MISNAIDYVMASREGSSFNSRKDEEKVFKRLIYDILGIILICIMSILAVIGLKVIIDEGVLFEFFIISVICATIMSIYERVKEGIYEYRKNKAS